MTYINIPTINCNNIDFDIIYYDSDCSSNTKDAIYICESLYYYLTNIKKQINLYENQWDIYKKFTNPYEYIHSQVPNSKFSVCKHKPLSRSFFKMIEIINTFSFLTEKKTIKSFHLAEGPGGFIEAFNYKRNNKNDVYYGMTLISNNNNIPSWKKSSHFLNLNKNIIIENGRSNTGDLFLKENLQYCYNKYHNSMDYITADGGFDFSIDFNKQEDLSLKLIISQIFFALIMQNTGGHFIIKFFDIFKFKTVELIFLLANLYENIYIYKPNTSRIANSEKYIICKNYKYVSKDFLTKIINNFDTILNNIDNIKCLFNISIPKLFINKIQEINAIYGQQQIENINSTLNIIREFININSKNKNTNDNNGTGRDDKLESNFTVKNLLYNKLNSIENNVNYLYSSPELDDITDITNNNNVDNSSNNTEKYLYDKFYNKINIMKNVNLQKSINWCNKYSFPINKEFFNKDF
tara:strand:+ start:9991 stop:11388 length:1398 start_codon:yes stop_codon:yes gene_type:complete